MCVNHNTSATDNEGMHCPCNLQCSYQTKLQMCKQGKQYEHKPKKTTLGKIESKQSARRSVEEYFSFKISVHLQNQGQVDDPTGRKTCAKNQEV
jgi:hypothetical protein